MPETQLELVKSEISALSPKEIVSGAATGADTLAVRAAQLIGIPFTEFPAKWELYGKKAGPIRNKTMLLTLDKDTDMVLAFIPKTGITKGTKNMVELATKAGVKVRIVEYEL